MAMCRASILISILCRLEVAKWFFAFVRHRAVRDKDKMVIFVASSQHSEVSRFGDNYRSFLNSSYGIGDWKLWSYRNPLRYNLKSQTTNWIN